MKKVTLFMVVIFAAFAIQSCTIAKVGARGAVPLILNQPAESMQLIEHVSAKKQVTFDYTNAFDASEVLNEVIATKKPDAVINVSITIKTTPADYILNLVTCGLAASKTIVVDADLMKNK